MTRCCQIGEGAVCSLKNLIANSPIIWLHATLYIWLHINMCVSWFFLRPGLTMYFRLIWSSRSLTCLSLPKTRIRVTDHHLCWDNYFIGTHSYILFCICVHYVPACICTEHVCLVPIEARKKSWVPGIEVIESWCCHGVLGMDVSSSVRADRALKSWATSGALAYILCIWYWLNNEIFMHVQESLNTILSHTVHPLHFPSPPQ